MFHDFQLSSHSNVDLTLPSQAPTRTGHKILKSVINGLHLQPADLQHAQNTLRYQETKTKTSNFNHTVPELHTQFFDSGSHKPSPALDGRATGPYLSPTGYDGKWKPIKIPNQSLQLRFIKDHRKKKTRDSEQKRKMIGEKSMKQYTNVLDKPLSKGKQEVSLSAFAFLFSELVQYNQTQVDNIAELERRLEDAGYAVGARVLELLCHREKVADSLEKGTEHEDEYMISEKELLVNRFISIPKDMGTFNCGAFVAGIVRGVLDGAGFPAVVTAHFVPVEGQARPRTTILIKFAEEVLRREARLG
ncbi:hypothetical protein Droror1_Dr00024035 [Drosera rotundifolia]